MKPMVSGVVTGGVTTYAVTGRVNTNTATNTADLDLVRGEDATTDVTATYTGDAVGIAVRDKTSGQFTADVTLTATFADLPTNSTLDGTISGFDIAGTDPGWTVMLEETKLTVEAALAEWQRCCLRRHPAPASGRRRATVRRQWIMIM